MTPKCARSLCPHDVGYDAKGQPKKYCSQACNLAVMREKRWPGRQPTASGLRPVVRRLAQAGPVEHAAGSGPLGGVDRGAGQDPQGVGHRDEAQVADAALDRGVRPRPALEASLLGVHGEGLRTVTGGVDSPARAQSPQAVDGPSEVGLFGNGRAPALVIAGPSRKAAHSRQALEALAVPVVDIIADSMNELRLAAEQCKIDKDPFNQIGALRVLGAIGMKLVEQAQGKRMTLDVNVRSQEDLVQWNSLSPETRMKLEAAFDAVEREKGTRALTGG